MPQASRQGERNSERIPNGGRREEGNAAGEPGGERRPRVDGR